MAYLIEDEDVVFEEDILRNPFVLKGWQRYLDHKKYAPQAVRNQIFERALKQVPGSYKLWHKYLGERRRAVRAFPPNDPARKDVNQAHERALVFMHKMPRIWLDYLEFLVDQRVVTKARRAFDDALRALPVTQHHRIWPLYLDFVRGHNIPETGVRIFRRYLMIEPNAAEEYIEYLLTVGRLDDAALKLVAVLNNSEFVSPSGKSHHQLWVQLCELICKHPEEIVSLNVETIIRAGLRKFTDMVGALWCSLSDYFIRCGNFEKARDVFEESIQTVMTVRDFSQVFNAYTTFEEQNAEALIEELADDDDGADNVEVQLRLARYEDLMDRRPKLKNSVLLRQNPHNVVEWLKRVDLFKPNKLEMLKTFSQALQAIDPTQAVGKMSDLWIKFSQMYIDEDEPDEARTIMNRAVRSDFINVDELASVWCHFANMEVELGESGRALKVLKRATAVPPHKSFPKGQVPPQYRLHRNLKVWSLYADLEESFGTFQSAKAVYTRMLELRVVTPQIIINFAMLLEENRYFEEAFTVYERGIAIFKWPLVYEIWNIYLVKFIERYGGEKLERTRELFEQAVEGCPPKHARALYLLYAHYEEEHGLARHAMAVYDRGTKAVQPEERNEVWKRYIARAADIFGATYTRELYSRAIEELDDDNAREMCLEFANLERKLGEIDRARAIYAHASQFCDPRTTQTFWKTWQEFEVRHGNEDTFREMLRIKRSVAASYNTSVNFSASGYNASATTSTPADTMAALEADVTQSKSEATKMQFVKKGGDAAPPPTSQNADEINLDDDDDDDDDQEDLSSIRAEKAQPEPSPFSINLKANLRKVPKPQPEQNTSTTAASPIKPRAAMLPPSRANGNNNADKPQLTPNAKPKEEKSKPSKPLKPAPSVPKPAPTARVVPKPPVPAAKPVASPKPVPKAKPTLAPRSTLNTSAPTKPVPSPKPTGNPKKPDKPTKPAIGTKPTIATKPAMGSKPTIATKPEIAGKPTSQKPPMPSSKPVVLNKSTPATAPPTNLASKPRPVPKASPKPKPAPPACKPVTPTNLPSKPPRPVGRPVASSTTPASPSPAPRATPRPKPVPRVSDQAKKPTAPSRPTQPPAAKKPMPPSRPAAPPAAKPLKKPSPARPPPPRHAGSSDEDNGVDSDEWSD
eukprot:m.151894 g.151894  ORF g.151894 m.151894 type:complete len:1145 (-) comp24526_c1_seq1:392-3826(-)